MVCHLKLEGKVSGPYPLQGVCECVFVMCVRVSVYLCDGYKSLCVIM